MGDERVECSDLPEELLPTIVKSLETHIDFLRFRSVCNSWRSNCLPFTPASPLEFPHPHPHPQPADLAPWLTSETAPARAYLIETTLYLMQRLNPSTSSDHKGMLIKVDDTNSSRNRYESNPPHVLSNHFNLLDFRALELTKSYTLKSQLCFFPTRGLNKVIKFPNSARTNGNDSAIFVVYSNGKLGFARCGDENMSIVGGRCIYDDVIVYKGQLYVVDRWGIVWLIRLELELVPFSQSIDGSDLCSPKYLVESCGALYVVDKERRGRHGTTPKVYELNEEELGRWDLVNSLGDRAFVLGYDCCFSVSAEEFSGFKRNCIYFTEQYGSGTRVFNLEDRRFEDLAYFQSSHLAWPLSNLL
jgi:hypothetical protein